ncbi:hypothetical protein [Hymenobacter edaphi]|uniref:T9SS C-terminal target domain-containing protein n=1 Tax=Hymenobacter edaphi TaxID=2211146 RepID=A0A328BB71_9BACT|nr:hypothetical protein [Hymenobacter edaphi]RAK63885.1 hypothetical protein DLM85_20270 [Hymenobacter edaphi]
MHTFTSLRRRTLAVLALLLSAALAARAQFATPALDGTITAAEYSGNNGGTWYLTWDDTYLYIAKTDGNAAEQTLIYLDVDPVLPATSGSNANGNTAGLNDYNMTPNLPFRADVRVYMQNSYIEFQTRNGSGGWGGFSSPSTGNIELLRSGNNRELRIRWASLPGLTGRPASFNWLGMQGSTGSPSFIYDQTPGANYAGNSSSTPDFRYYFTVSSTANGAATNPFSRTSFTYANAANLNLGALSLYDFSLNAPGGSVTRTGGAWTVDGSLVMLNGTLDFGSSSTALTARNVAVGGNSTLRLSSAIGGDLNVKGNLSIVGTFQPNNRSVDLTGTTQSISGGAPTTPIVFDYLNVGGSGTKTSTALLTVNQALNFQGGILSTGTQTLTLAGNATLSETATSYLRGRLQMSRDLSQVGTTYTYPDGLQLTPRAAPLPGLTTALRTTGTAATGDAGNASILRQYQLTAPTSTGLRYDVVFPYRDAELNGIPAANLYLYRSATDGAPWQPLPGASVDAGGRTVSRPGLTDLGTLTLGNAAAPLPVTLLGFAAEGAGPAAVALRWTTAQEKNNAGFGVERSVDGRNFTPIGTVAGAGSSSSARSYRFVDAGARRTTTLYYRLRQTDFDGTTAYSAVAAVAAAATALQLVPSPAHDWLSVTAAGDTHAPAATVLDLQGRIRLRGPLYHGQARLYVGALPAGVYVLRVGGQTARFLKQ